MLIGQWEHGQAHWNNLPSPRLVEALHIVKACALAAAGQKTVNLDMGRGGHKREHRLPKQLLARPAIEPFRRRVQPYNGAIGIFDNQRHGGLHKGLGQLAHLRISPLAPRHAGFELLFGLLLRSFRTFDVVNIDKGHDQASMTFALVR